MSPFVYPEQWKLLSKLSSCHHFQLLIHLVLATLGSSLFKNVLLLSGLYACAHTISSLSPTQAPIARYPPLFKGGGDLESHMLHGD